MRLFPKIILAILVLAFAACKMVADEGSSVAVDDQFKQGLATMGTSITNQPGVGQPGAILVSGNSAFIGRPHRIERFNTADTLNLTSTDVKLQNGKIGAEEAMKAYQKENTNIGIYRVDYDNRQFVDIKTNKPVTDEDTLGRFQFTMNAIQNTAQKGGFQSSSASAGNGPADIYLMSSLTPPPKD